MHLTTSHRTAEVLILLFVGATVLVAASILLAAGASAQPLPGQTQTPNGTTPASGGGSEPVRIQQGLLLHSSSYDAGTGLATVTLENTGDTLLAVTLTDAGAFQQGGEIPRKTEVLQPGKHTIQIPATQTESGAVGVTVGTKDVLYAVPIEAQTDWFEGDPNWGTVRTASLFAALGVVLAVAGEAYRRRRGGRTEVTRKA